MSKAQTDKWQRLQMTSVKDSGLTSTKVDKCLKPQLKSVKGTNWQVSGTTDDKCQRLPFAMPKTSVDKC